MPEKIRKVFVAGLAVCSLLISNVKAISAEGSESKPNIVIILVDDMGYGDAKCFNKASKIATPHINRLAQEGMCFTDAHAPGPLCHLSRYGLLTGQYPFRAATGKWRNQPSIAEGQMTIASLAKSQGYQTAMVGKWHLGFDESGGYENPLTGGPVDRGFDSYFGIRASTDIPPYFYIRDDRAVLPPTRDIGSNSTEGWSPIQGEFWREGKIAPDLELEDVTPRFTEEAIKVIQDHGKKQDDSPLMLYLAYPSPHTPWLPSDAFRGSSLVGLYGDFMTMVDAEIGKVFSALDEANMKDETLVIFTSDNGPVWYDADAKKYQHDSAGSLRGMKADAWEAGHRMPFIVRWPKVVKPNSRSAQPICFTDVLSTMAEIFGVALPSQAAPDSFSFLQVLLSEQPEDVSVRGPIVMSPGGGDRQMMIRSGNWKLIKGLGSGGFSKPRRIDPTEGGPTGQLYNLSEDLGEQNNLFQSRPDVVERLLQEMEQIIQSECSRELDWHP